MSSVNSVTLIGNVGGDPEVKTTQTGRKVCRLSLATSEVYNRQGETQEKTVWHQLVFWDRNAENVEKYVKKGHKLYIEGRLAYNEWVDEMNQKRKNTEIVVNRFVMLTSRNSTSQRDLEESAWDQPASEDLMKSASMTSFPF